jgi:hypothetical protein
MSARAPYKRSIVGRGMREAGIIISAHQFKLTSQYGFAKKLGSLHKKSNRGMAITLPVLHVRVNGILAPCESICVLRSRK